MLRYNIALQRSLGACGRTVSAIIPVNFEEYVS
jgi:hypothetical protein